MPRQKKIKCKGCVYACCDNIVLEMITGTKSPDPDKLPTGAWIYESGIWFIKKANGRWRCRAFDVKKKICKIYPYRPPVCRWFKCPHAKKTKLVRMPDNNYSIINKQYTIILFSKRKLKKGKPK